mgnify:CR=1 FL=1
MSMKFSEYAKDVIGKVSAGILLCKYEKRQWMFFIVHPGGPYYVNKWEYSKRYGQSWRGYRSCRKAGI